MKNPKSEIRNPKLNDMTDKMIKIAGVRFRENWKVYDFDATEVEVGVGDKVIVDSDRGPGFATVVRLKRQEAPSAPATPEPVQEAHGLQFEGEEGDAAPVAGAAQAPKTLRIVLRKAAEDDLVREKKNMAREAEAFKIALDMITERELPMKLIRVEYSFDASRATFFFFSETRVDFRELVKDLAYKLKSRIEMRQIGVRDVARMIGGFGPCGRELCCSAFLKNFEPVSIRMAKKQEMVLNPAKISGVCGRLLCCLSYEYGMYDEIKKDLAGMREASVKEKKDEEERRIADERQEAEERRLAEDKRRQEDRKQQEQRKPRQKEGGQRAGGRPEKKKDRQQEKKAQPRPEPPRDRQQQPRPEKLPPQQQEQTEQTEQTAEGDKSGKRKKRRFWRKKKKGQQQEGTPNPPKAD
jgi:cell fate regulator YaaT (PSP1 superfamily)